MKLVDTHAHLTWDSFQSDLKEVVQRSSDCGIKIIINVGADLESSRKAAELESPNSEVSFYSSVGLHPHEAFLLSTTESIHKHIEKLEHIHHTHSKKVIAVGECGLDYHFNNTPDLSPATLSNQEQAKQQKGLFLEHITLAKKLDLPLIIHCREAWNDIFLLELNGLKGVFHSFTGSPEDAQKVLSFGFHLGFSCPVTYPKNNSLREIINNTPLDKIITETDCPFLPPQSQRGQRNEPANVLEVVRVISEVKGLSEEEVAQITCQNAQNLFNTV